MVMDLEDADDNHVHVQEDVPDAVGSIEQEEVAVDSTEEDLEVEALRIADEEALRVEVSADEEALHVEVSADKKKVLAAPLVKAEV